MNNDICEGQLLVESSTAKEAAVMKNWNSSGFREILYGDDLR